MTGILNLDPSGERTGPLRRVRAREEQALARESGTEPFEFQPVQVAAAPAELHVAGRRSGRRGLKVVLRNIGSQLYDDPTVCSRRMHRRQPQRQQQRHIMRRLHVNKLIIVSFRS